MPTTWDGIWWAVVGRRDRDDVGYGDVKINSVGGRLIAIVVMLVGLGFISVLTAAVASRFVKHERSGEHTELIEALQRIEADVAELKSRL